MKSHLKRIAAAFLAALVGVIPAAFAQTTTLTAADLFPSDIDMVFELNTSVDNPLEDYLREMLYAPDNEIGTMLLELADNNKVNLAVGNLSDAGNEAMYLSLETSAEDFAEFIGVTEATESETYLNVKIYMMETDAYAALVKNLLVVTSSPENMKRVIDNSFTAVDNLGAGVGYKSVVSHDIPNAFFKMYMDPAVFMKLIDEEMSVSSMAGSNFMWMGILEALDAQSVSVSKNEAGFGFGVANHADSAKLAETGYSFDKYNFTPSLYKLLSGKGLILYQERTNLNDQFAEAYKMLEGEDEALAELDTFKSEMLAETDIDFDDDLLPLFDGNYLITVHNANALLPGVTGIFKVSDRDSAGKVALKLSEYLEKKLMEEQANYSEKIYDSEIYGAGGTSFYGYTIYLKAIDDGGDLSGLTDEAATLYIRLAVTSDGYFVVSTLPDLNGMFGKGGEGLMDNAGLKSSFTDPTAIGNDILYLDIDSLNAYIGVLMNIFDADAEAKEQMAAIMAPWHSLFIRGYGTADTAWVKGQVNVDIELLGDFTQNMYEMFNAFSNGFNEGMSSDFAPDLNYDGDLLDSLGFEKNFCDVSEDDWFHPYVQDLSAQGIIKGYEDGCFHPERSVTRAEFIKMTMMAFGKAAAINSSYKPFTDVPPIYGEWYSENVNMAAMLGYVNGYEDGSFRPNGTITRAEAMQILYNMSDVLQSWVKDSGTPYEPMVTFGDVRSNDWFYIPVSAAADYGIVGGNGSGHFDPNRNLTRAEAAKIIDLLLLDWEYPAQ